ncbi:MAG: integrase, partial [Geobacter sp.]
MSEARYRRLNGYLRSFFREYLQIQRGVSVNTIQSYRDTWCLLLRYGIEHKKMPRAEDWRVYQVDRQLILDFLIYLEDERRVCARTRNTRLAAIHAFLAYLRIFEPELESHCLRILSIPSKKTCRTIIGFLESDELLSVLQSISLQNPLGHRDLALLVFSYNTGARVHEIANACKNHIIPGTFPVIRILGKGGKERIVPLWESTIYLLEVYFRKYRVSPKAPAHSEYLFLSNRGQKLTRFQVGRIIT